MIFAFALMAVAGIVYYILCVVENRTRDLAHGSVSSRIDGAHLQDSDGLDDMTDMQNKNFRYTY